MKVKVQYLGPIRAMLDKREEEVEVSLETTIYELLKNLASLYGKAFAGEVFEEDGKISETDCYNSEWNSYRPTRRCENQFETGRRSDSASTLLWRGLEGVH